MHCVARIRVIIHLTVYSRRRSSGSARAATSGASITLRHADLTCVVMRHFACVTTVRRVRRELLPLVPPPPSPHDELTRITMRHVVCVTTVRRVPRELLPLVPPPPGRLRRRLGRRARVGAPPGRDAAVCRVRIGPLNHYAVTAAVPAWARRQARSETSGVLYCTALDCNCTVRALSCHAMQCPVLSME